MTKRTGAMTDFDKQKVGFAVALLAVLFTTEPFINKPDLTFQLFGIELSVTHGYTAMSTVLGLAVYSYAVQLITKTPWRWLQGIGNILYGLAMAIPLLFVGLYGVSVIAPFLGGISQSTRVQDGTTYLFSIVAIGIAVWFWWTVVRLLKRREIDEFLTSIRDTQLRTLNRANEFLERQELQLAVIEATKALECTVRRAIAGTGIVPLASGASQLVKLAEELGVLSQDLAKRVTKLLLVGGEGGYALSELSERSARSIVQAVNELVWLLDYPRDSSDNPNQKPEQSVDSNHTETT